MLCGLYFYGGIREPPWDIFLGLTVSGIGSFLRIERAGVSFLLFLQGICFWYGVIVAKLAPNTEKTEISKLSWEIITSAGLLFFLIG